MKERTEEIHVLFLPEEMKRLKKKMKEIGVKNRSAFVRKMVLDGYFVNLELEDVGHQSYVHKILTGRKKELENMRKFGGIAGFPKTKESKYDAFNTGHSSTSISAALGMARARDLKGKNNRVIAVIGDGALTGGII